MSAAGPLSGTLVVGLEHSVAGPLCTRILGEMGADVVKVERPDGGDFSRHWDHNAGGDSAQFWWLNGGKRSIALDVKSASGRAAFDALLNRADVLVQNLSAGAAERLGLRSPEFEAQHPRLIHCQISGYGADGPLRDRKAYDMLVQAEAGIMSVTGTPDTPMRTGVSVCDVGTGIYAATLVLAALVERRETGRGRRLDVAMFDAALEFLGPMLLSAANSGVVYPRIPQRHHAIAPYGTFVCGDGRSVLLAVEQDDEWAILCSRLLGDAALAQDPRFITNVQRIANREAVDELVGAALRRTSSADAIRLLEEMGLGHAMLNDATAVAAHPVVTAREILAEATNDDGDTVTTLKGMAERLFERPARSLRPPRLDEHGDAILAEIGHPRERL